MIEAGPHARQSRRVATSGPLVRQIDRDDELRDLPIVAPAKRTGRQGI